MKLGLFDLAIRKTQTLEKTAPVLSTVYDSRGGWWPVIRESFPGAWQRDLEVRADDALAYFAVYACMTLIAGDVSKCCLRLVQKDSDGIWTEAESASFSPVLKKPNRYQNRIKFFEQWIVSKLSHGNTYVLKERDKRGVVVAMYILDPTRVRVLVAPSGDVYYSLSGDNLADLPDATVVPASEIIHDIQCALFHPLVGVSPIYACGIAAMQGLSIQSSGYRFFASGSKPGGVLTAPGAIAQETADRLKKYWDDNFTGENVGKVAVLGDGLTYEAMSVNATDAQLIEQLRFSAETVCSAFHVLPYMIGIGPPPPYANVEPLLMAYYAQALQVQFGSIELCLDEGVGIDKKIDGVQYGTEFDIDDLIWMDTATRTKAATDSISGAAMSPDEARRKFLGMGKIPGGRSAYLQQQYYSLEALAKRDAKDDPFTSAKPPEPPPAQPGTPPPPPAPPKSLDVDWAELIDTVVREVEVTA